MKKEWTVYKHTAPNGKVYIGITCRKPEYRRKNGKGYIGQIFGRAIEKYGWDNIQHEIIAEGLTKEEAGQMEIELIAKYRSNDSRFGYNDESGGFTPKQSYKTKKKNSEAHKGKCGGENNGFYGKKHTDETKKKLSQIKIDYFKNNKHPNQKEVSYDNILFSSIAKCAEYIGISPTFLSSYLTGSQPMPKELYEKGLKITNTDIQYTVQTGHKSGGENKSAVKVVYDGIIFGCIKDLAEYIDRKPNTVQCWLTGRISMPKEHYDKGLRYLDKDNSKIRVNNK